MMQRSPQPQKSLPEWPDREATSPSTNDTIPASSLP